MVRKTYPLSIKQPTVGSNDDEDSSNSEEEKSSSDEDAPDVNDALNEPMSTSFGCPIIEELFHKP